MNRDVKIANLRVFAILSVVFAHSVILYTKGWNTFVSPRSSDMTAVILMNLKTIVARYHMPLFMSISGYLFYYSSLKKQGPFSFFGNKVLRLLVPYLFVGAAWMIPVKILSGLKGYTWEKYFSLIYEKVILAKGNGHLWYLIALFIIFIICYFVVKASKIIKNSMLEKVYDFSVLTVFLVLNYFADDLKKIVSINCIYRVFLYLFWFYLGYILCKYFELTKNKTAAKSVFIPWIALIVGFMLTGRMVFKLPKYFYWFYDIIAIITLVVLLYIIIPEKEIKLTKIIEKNSFGLYLFHSPMVYFVFANMLDRNPLLVAFITFFVCSAIAILITVLLRKAKLGFLIGEKVR